MRHPKKCKTSLYDDVDEDVGQASYPVQFLFDVQSLLIM